VHSQNRPTSAIFFSLVAQSIFNCALLSPPKLFAYAAAVAFLKLPDFCYLQKGPSPMVVYKEVLTYSSLLLLCGRMVNALASGGSGPGSNPGTEERSVHLHLDALVDGGQEKNILAKNLGIFLFLPHASFDRFDFRKSCALFVTYVEVPTHSSLLLLCGRMVNALAYACCGPGSNPGAEEVA
jgi:hypothetical protein